MARVAINTGAAANDGTGDTLRAAGGVINNNFLEVYTYLGAGSTTTLSAPVWSTTNAGINTLRNVGIGTTNPTSALTVTGDGIFTGVVTATTFVGALTGTATTATGLSGTPNITVGTISATSLNASGVSTSSTLNVGTGGTVITTTTTGLVGIGTTNPRFTLEVGAVGASGTTLFVNGNARITGILTIGTSSITLNGATNIINVGTGITINGSTGIISATSIVVGGTTLTGAAVTRIEAGSGISVDQNTGQVTITATGGGGTGAGTTWVATNAGIHTTKNVGIGTTNPTSALTVVGSGTSTSQLFVTGVSTFVGLITAGRITAGLTSSIIPFYYDTYASLPSYSTYHGAVAHAHDTGKLYYAHTRWVELVNTESDGTVGTGTEKYNIGITSVTTLNVSGVSTFAGITTVTGSTLFAKQLSVSGVVTATTFIGAVTGNVTGNATGLSGTPNITVGTVGATSLNVSGVSTVGVVTGATYYGDASYVVSGKWTVGNNGASDYTFAGIGFTETTNDPILYLARGGVYEFVITSGGSHPFQIRVSNGGAAYNNGITNNGATSGTLRFEVPFNAPNTLFYQCTSHSGMGNTISIYPNTI